MRMERENIGVFKKDGERKLNRKGNKNELRMKVEGKLERRGAKCVWKED